MTIGEPSRCIGFVVVDVEAARKPLVDFRNRWNLTVPIMKEGQMVDVRLLNNASVQLGKDLF